MIVIYVAGPYTAPDRAGTEANIAAAAELGLRVAELGACPLVPHCLTSDPRFETVQPYEFWIDGTAELLRRSDAVIFTEDWERSSGARGENVLADELSIPRFYRVSDLAGWLRGQSREMDTLPAPDGGLDSCC